VSGRVIDVLELKLPDLWTTVFDVVSGRFKRRERNQKPPRFFSLDDEHVAAIDATSLTDPNPELRKRLMQAIVAGRKDAERILGLYDCENGDKTIKAYRKEYFLLRQSVGHQVWFTRSKYLALVPPIECQKGDMITIAHGSRVPLLLRARNDDTFQLLSHCYRENAMYGEAVTWAEDEADILPLA